MEESAIEGNLKKHIETFSFPRLAGTQGEKRAVKVVEETFKSIGFKKEEIERQEFIFSTFYSEIFVKIVIFTNIISLLMILLAKYINPILIYLFVICFLLIFLSMNKVFKHPELKGFWEKNLGKKVSATNIFIKIPSKKMTSDDANNIVVSAHLDSKSQTYETIWRVLFFRMWIYGEVSLSILYVIYLLEYHQISSINIYLSYFLEIGIVIATASVITSNIALLFLKVRNKSPGSLDNATGMSIIFELSAFFKNNPLSNYNLWICQFSAEEIGTMGSRNFIDWFEQKFPMGKAFQFNFDMVSARPEKNNYLQYIKSYGIFPKKKISPTLRSVVEISSNELDIGVKSFHVPVGAHTDSLPFHLKKFDAIDFTTRAAARYTHSKKDTPDKVDIQILNHAYLLVKRAILKLDNQALN
ncbi:MAG: M28 family peptidase [Candidatus Lokiarchaeota archaeon]|nr:M28 family peptidase [Candidatus Lokiarchaeota archaeon]